VPSTQSPPPPSISSRNTSYPARPSKLGGTSLSTSPVTTGSALNERRSLTTQNFARPSSDVSRPPSFSQPSFPAPPAPPRLNPPMAPSVQPKPTQFSFSAPNYNISMAPSNPPSLFTTPISPPAVPMAPIAPQQFGMMTTHMQPTPPAMGGLLIPSRPAQSTSKSSNSLSKDDWASFDPLS